MQDYPIDFHTIINISHDGNAVCCLVDGTV
jgi:hypothetical protein